MKLQINLDDFRVTKGKDFRIKKAKTKVKSLYRDNAHYEELIAQFRTEIDELQQKMYAQDRHGMLLIFQAMDAAGKDSTIKHVMSGVNTEGVESHAFKRPTSGELDHDFLWRHIIASPPAAASASSTAATTKKSSSAKSTPTSSPKSSASPSKPLPT